MTDSIETETQQVMDNMRAVLDAAGMTFENGKINYFYYEYG
jgi:2-iminobutanoate/2-iminopropanoate deaminase